MTSVRRRLRTVFVAAALLIAGAPPFAVAQDGSGTGGPAVPPNPGTSVDAGVGREGMWPAPTAADWAKPVLITFQRTWEDAVAVAQEENRAILVCINMDGEIASEHYAGVRYRQPEAAALYAPYVCVIASVYRHAERDFDDEGNRIPCPRFGSVTCGEHIAIEPFLFEKFLDGQRVAPRHIMVELDPNGTPQEKFDAYYVNDTAGVFRAIIDGIAEREETPRVVVRGDRPVTERVGSRDVRDRQAVEDAWREGDAAQRARLLEAAKQHADKDPVDLLRLGVFGVDPDNAAAARRALAETEATASVNLIVDALRAPMAEDEREALLDALTRLGEGSSRARWLAVTQRGLAGRSAAVDVNAWATAGGTYGAAPATDVTEVIALEERAAMATETDGGGAAVLVDLAEVYLAEAMELRKAPGADPRTARVYQRLKFDDARRMTERAMERGAGDWRVHGIRAIAAYYGGDPSDAYAHAEEAVALLPPGEGSWNSMAVLAIFAESRWKDIKAAVKEKREWPPKWLTDLHSTYSVLRRHPHGTDAQVLWHHELVMWLGSKRQALRILEEGIERFPQSPSLHAKLVARALELRGPRGVELAYDRLLGDQPSAAMLVFAARAEITLAEHLRNTRRPEPAMEAYAKAVERIDAALEAAPERRIELDRVVALAHAARARLAYQLDDDDLALEEILASFARAPQAAGDRDAPGFTPGETAQMLLARLKEREKTDAAQRLEAALAGLEAELLRPDRGLLGPPEGE